MKEIDELNDLLQYQEYYCDTCGVKMVFPLMRATSFHRHGGSEIYYGEYKCPTNKWYKIGHDPLLVEYRNCDLRIFEREHGNWEFMERLYLHQLKERKSEST